MTSVRIPRVREYDTVAPSSRGDRADLPLVEGETPTSAVMDRGKDRTVPHDGVVVADGLSVADL